VLDATGPNMVPIALGMGKPTRNELLAEYYLRAAGVAAVWIDVGGQVGAQDVASIENESGRIVYCCERGVHFTLAYHLYEWKKAGHRRPAGDRGQARGARRSGRRRFDAACRGHRAALAAVAAVNETIDKMGSTGDLKAFNRAFKDARKVDPAIRYFDYIHARKAAMLEALAHG
jgi:hypothetical protein